MSVKKSNMFLEKSGIHFGFFLCYDYRAEVDKIYCCTIFVLGVADSQLQFLTKINVSRGWAAILKKKMSAEVRRRNRNMKRRSAEYIIRKGRMLAGVLAISVLAAVSAEEEHLEAAASTESIEEIQSAESLEVGEGELTEMEAEFADWDESVIYFMLTDRFYNGNTENDGEDCDPSDPGKYHGGDFAGVTEKLDYLKELGINTIWITPIVQNISEGQPTGEEDVSEMYGYHGYWAEDFTKLDSHLGTEEEFQTLVDEAHARGIKIMVDAVLNHAGYGTEEIFGDMIRGEEETVSGSEKKASIYGLPDFLTEKEEVRSQLIDWQTYWVEEFGIDCFRLDTLKHVDDETWQELHSALLEIDPDFRVIGEVYNAGYTYLKTRYESGQVDALLDFDFNNAALTLAAGKLQNLENFMESRNAALTEDMTMGGFLSSHDENGLMFELTNRGFSDEEAWNLTKVAVSMQMTAKGIPVIYYGEELGQTGKNNYPYQENRYDLDWSAVNEENDMLQHYQAMLTLRNTYSDVLARGTRTALLVDEEQGVLVFDRCYEGEHLIVALNISEEAKTVTFELPEGMESVSGNLYEAALQTVQESGIGVSEKKEVTETSAQNGETPAGTEEQDGTEGQDDLNGESVQVKDRMVTITVPAAGDGGTDIRCEMTSVSMK